MIMFNTVLMKNVFILALITLFFYHGVQDLKADTGNAVAQEQIENTWVVDYIADNTVHATVNGQVTHGDRLHIRMVKGHCELGNLITFVYTYSNHPKIEQIGETYVQTRFMNDDVVARIVGASPFLMGHRATIDFGFLPLNELSNILLKSNPISVEYLDSEEIKISDYFDITTNSWSNAGLDDAINYAKIACEDL